MLRQCSELLAAIAMCMAVIATGGCRVMDKPTSKPEDHADLQTADAQWGMATQGVQIRLAGMLQEWNEGETPAFSASIQNTGEGEWSIYQSEALWTVELDGVRYVWSGESGVKSSWLPPGRKYEDIRITLTSAWQSTQAGSLKLAPGKHTLKVICPVFARGASSPAFEVVSNTVEFDVRSAR